MLSAGQTKPSVILRGAGIHPDTTRHQPPAGLHVRSGGVRIEQNINPTTWRNRFDGCIVENSAIPFLTVTDAGVSSSTSVGSGRVNCAVADPAQHSPLVVQLELPFATLRSSVSRSRSYGKRR